MDETEYRIKEKKNTQKLHMEVCKSLPKTGQINFKIYASSRINKERKVGS